MTFGLIYEVEENVVDASPYRSAQIQKFAVNPVECCLEEVALARILRVEQLK